MIAGVQLEQVLSFKYLGLTLTTHTVDPSSGIFFPITQQVCSRAQAAA